MLSRLSEIGGALSSGWISVWPTQLLALIWLAWVVSWVVAASWSARTKTHVRTRDSWVYRLPILLGAILLSPWTSQALGESRIYDPGDFGTYALAVLVLVGVSFTWWARRRAPDLVRGMAEGAHGGRFSDRRAWSGGLRTLLPACADDRAVSAVVSLA
jgi:hypothetical protein